MGTRAAATGSPFFHQSVHAGLRCGKVKRIVTTNTLTCCLKGWIPMKAPAIPTSAYLAPGAQIVGDVTLGERCSVWYNAVLRGDCAPIVVGAETNLQDAAVIHCSTGAPAVIGSGVTVGHGAILHSCTIGDCSLIGMGAIVLDGATVGRECLVGAGALVTPRTVIPDGTLAVGSPARVKRSLTPEERAHLRENAEEYLQLAFEAMED